MIYNQFMEKDLKIYFTLPDPKGPATESVNAEMISSENYKILNTPFFVYNIAWGDIVTVREENGLLYADNLVSHSGHSTVRIFFLKELSLDEMQKYLHPLNEMNCFYEHSKERFFALDIPPEVDYSNVEKYLSKLELDGIIEYEEGFISSRT